MRRLVNLLTNTFILAVTVYDGSPVVFDLPYKVQGRLGDERILVREVFGVNDGQPGVGDVVVQVPEKCRRGANLLGALRLQEFQDFARTLRLRTAQTPCESHA